ncbi:MAG: DUF5658 family protein [Candidatus Bathyarchaeota archaeon]|nr:DUF5658 family protein [Candidatus Bathyarchaeota archaeon]
MELIVLESIFKKVLFCTVLVEVLLFADFLSTYIIFALGGVELNPIVNAVGFLPISALKLLGGAFCGLLCYYGKRLFPLFLMLTVFSVVVSWNIGQIFMLV